MKVVLLDGLNYYTRFQKHQNNFWDIQAFTESIQKTVNGFQKSGYDLRVFIDVSRITPEAVKKHTSRIELKLIKDDFKYPPFKETLLGDAFKQCGIYVYYSFDNDNDDTMAFYAQKFNASIISQDQDFFRYLDSAFLIYDDFKLKKGKMMLVEAKERKNPKKVIKKREILENAITSDMMPFFIYLEKGSRVFSAPSPLLKVFGNLFVATRPLRQAIYARYNIPTFKETIIQWVDDQPQWISEIVKADATFDHLLLDSEKAIQTLLPNYLIRPSDVQDIEWDKHLFGVYATVLENIAAITNTPLLTLMEPIAKRHMEQKGPEVVSFQCMDCNATIAIDATDPIFRRLKFNKTKRCKRCHWQSKQK